MVANLLYHKGRTARWFTTQWAFGTMCVALALTRGQSPANLVAGPVGPRLRKWRLREALQEGSVVRLVLEDKYWCLLTH